MNKTKVIGFVLLILDLLWISRWSWLFYAYNFTEILWLFMYPDWILILNMSFGLIGFYSAIRLVKKKASIKNTLLIHFALFLTGSIISYLLIS